LLVFIKEGLPYELPGQTCCLGGFSPTLSSEYINLPLDSIAHYLKADSDVATQFVNFACSEQKSLFVNYFVLLKLVKLLLWRSLKFDSFVLELKLSLLFDVIAQVLQVEVVHDEAELIPSVRLEEQFVLIRTDERTLLQNLNASVLDEVSTILEAELTSEKLDRVRDAND
jgi:hypothetical protein